MMNRHGKQTSELPGVYWIESMGMWASKITINKVVKRLGFFQEEEEAFEAYKKAVEEIGETVITKGDYYDK